MRELTAAEVLRLRMESLLLGQRRLDSPLEIVTWFGAMQAQDLASGKWSFGVRLPAATESDIDDAIEHGEVLRTWPMRGTIHFVPPADASWMLAHTGRKALAGAAARREYLGLDLATVEKAADVLSQALRGGKRLTRSQAVAVLHDAGIETAGQHSYHLIWYVSQIGVTCIGPNQGKEQTIVLLDEWAGPQRAFERRQGLAELALRYLRSHGPTSHTDFAGWAGITVTEARTAITDNEPNLVAADYQGKAYWMLASLPDSVSRRSKAPSVALPGFDEYLLGFKDRSLMLADDHKQHIIPGNNGMFQATMVDRGRVIGTWRRSVKRHPAKKARADITPLPFEPLNKRQESSMRSAFAAYGRYLGLPVNVG